MVEACGRALWRAVCGRRNQGLCFDQEGAHALDGGRDGHARKAFVVLREQQFRGVGDGAQTILSHFVDAEFRCASEPIFDGAQNAIHVVLVAFELDNGVDNVF